MRAMMLDAVRDLRKENEPLRATEVDVPEPGEGEVRIRVNVCGVCHTELDEIEGRLTPPGLPVIPGHQVVGTIDACGKGAETDIGTRVGVGWIFSACGDCEFCERGDENLCPDFKATGHDRHGGYAEYLCVPEAFAIPIPDRIDDIAAAPLFCAGAIGYRSLSLAGMRDGDRIGLTGFGASAHLVLKLVQHQYPSSDIYVFARGDDARDFARELGAVWAGETSEAAPERLHAIIDTTPAWRPVKEALGQLLPGGRLVINAIRKEADDQKSLLELDYPDDLWLEKEIKSVANVTRRDIREFLSLAAEMEIDPSVEIYDLEEANRALVELKRGDNRGAKVLKIGTGSG